MRPDLAGSTGYIRECWYVAGRSEDFARELTSVTILDDRIVIFHATNN